MRFSALGPGWSSRSAHCVTSSRKDLRRLSFTLAHKSCPAQPPSRVQRHLRPSSPRPCFWVTFFSFPHPSKLPLLLGLCTYRVCAHTLEPLLEGTGTFYLYWNLHFCHFSRLSLASLTRPVNPSRALYAHPFYRLA